MYVYSVTILTMGALVPGTWEERSRFMVSDLHRLPSGRGISSQSLLPLLPSQDGDAQRVLSASRDEGLQLLASFSACRVALPCPLPIAILLPKLACSIFAGASLLQSLCDSREQCQAATPCRGSQTTTVPCVHIWMRRKDKTV